MEMCTMTFFLSLDLMRTATDELFPPSPPLNINFVRDSAVHHMSKSGEDRMSNTVNT